MNVFIEFLPFLFGIIAGVFSIGKRNIGKTCSATIAVVLLYSRLTGEPVWFAIFDTGSAMLSLFVVRALASQLYRRQAK